MFERERAVLNAQCAARRHKRKYRFQTFDNFVLDILKIAQRASRAKEHLQ